ncbi:MAG: polysaccharide deacetylase family protein [Candidatus Theseobacter exili]|nr:polysaccharide deacetylase family protein [Candidatus Theseobacter exili]
MFYKYYLKAKRSWEKNIPDLLGLIGEYPRFVTSRSEYELFNELPVFCFHSVTKDRFEEQLAFLSRNLYRTLDTGEAAHVLLPGQKILPRSVVLTFDDGRKCLWKVAHPLLKKYKLKAVCFISPGLICDSNDSPDNDPLVSWDEVIEMHKEGTVDFQSHTRLHSLIPAGPKIIDYIRPGLDLQFRNTELPIMRFNGEDAEERNALPGMPVYESSPRMAGRLRYYDNENLRSALIDHVNKSGGHDFFLKANWRKELNNLSADLKKSILQDAYETEEQRSEAIMNELVSSREIIERRLPGKKVMHLCYPWFIGSDLSVALSKKAGYLSNYWGILKGRKTNRPGDDLYHITRVPEDYLFRLPGKGRKTLSACLKEKIYYLKRVC